MPVRGYMTLNQLERRKRKEHYKSAIAFICLMLFLIVFFCWIARAEPPSVIAPQWIKDAHKRHGIQMSMEYRGQHYFINKKGQRCRL